ncbi:MAG: M20 family metallopeptidase [Chloroflexi bacterium]|nr:M20 family metallopeptidase [Chloroflexota bacterium]
MEQLTCQVSRYVDGHFEVALETLEQAVNIDSFSRDPAGVNRMHALLIPLLERLGCAVEVRPQEALGSHVIARLARPRPGKILLMGHVDTVFPAGTVASRPFSVRDGRLWGPGVSDMKGGIAGIVSALEALLAADWQDRPTLEVLLTPDEEIGSPTSRAVIEERARDALAVFNLEPGRPDGSVVVERRGSAHVEIRVEGRAAHSGVWIEHGISAVEELAQKTIRLHALTDLARGLTVNVGLVEGGMNTNVVAPHASARVHLGFRTRQGFQELWTAVQRIVGTASVAGTRSTLHGGVSFEPMERHAGVDRLLACVRRAGERIGCAVEGTATRGASDAGFAACLGRPTLCGLGPVGGGWHSADEYAELASYPARIKLLALSIVEAAATFQGTG